MRHLLFSSYNHHKDILFCEAISSIVFEKFYFSILAITLLVSTITAQQLDMSAEIRPRLENKHGYKSLIQTNADGASFVSQRTFGSRISPR